MKKGWLIFFWLLAIIVISVLLWFLKPQETINNIIQAIAIVTLVFVTLFYAKRTEDLVKQEEKVLEEEKKKRIADFAEKRLHNFYLPLQVYLKQMIEILKLKPISIKFLDENILQIKKAFSQYGYMLSKDSAYAFISWQNVILKISNINSEEKKKEKWKEELLIEIDKLLKNLRKEIDAYKKKIYEFYPYSYFFEGENKS